MLEVVLASHRFLLGPLLIERGLLLLEQVLMLVLLREGGARGNSS